MKKTSELIWQDAQHQVLFQLLDELKRNRPDPTIYDRLHEYAENHFALEEAYMRELEYPDIERHVAAHDRFRSELTIMLADRDQIDDSMRDTLAFFLTEWLTRHIFGIDKALEEFILNSQRK